MKRILIAVIAVLTLSTSAAMAQDIVYGPKVGLNITDVTKMSNAAPRYRLAFGGFARYQLNDFWGLQAEALFSHQGAKVGAADLTLNYFKIPIMGRLGLIDKLYGEIGVSPNFLIKSEIKSEAWSGASLSAINEFDLTIPVGLSYEFLDGMEVGIRYDFAISYLDIPGASTAKTSNWMIGFSYRF